MNTGKRIVGGIAAAGIVISLAACSSDSGGDSSGDGGPVTLNVLLNGNAIGTNIEAMTDAFEDSHPDITVNVQVLAEQQMRDKEQLNLQSRSNAMDVYMTLPSREGPLFQASGYYEPLDDYAAGAEDGFLDGFSTIAIDGMKVDGATVAMPMNVEGPIMYYRTDLFEEAGIEVPESIDDLLSAAEALESSSDGSYVPITLRGQADALAYDFGAFFHAEGLDWVTDGEPNFTDPKAIEAIDQYATLASEYGPEGVINYSFNESTNLFASGGAAIELESSNLLPTIIAPETSSVIDTTGIATMPGGAPSILSWGLAMSPFSENKDASWEYIEWATNYDTQLETALLGIAPPRDALYEDETYTASLDTPLKQQWSEALQYLLTDGETEIGPVSQQAPEIRKIIGDGVGTVILGTATAEEAAQSIQDQISPLITE